MATEMRPAVLPALARDGRSVGRRSLWRNRARVALASGGTIGAVDQITVSLTGFALNLAIGRLTSPRDFGIYLLVTTIAWPLVELHTALVVSPFTMAVPRLPQEERIRYRLSAILQGLAAVLVAAAVGLFWLTGAAGFGSAPVPSSGTALVAALALAALVLREQTRRLRIAELDLLGALVLDATAMFLLIGTLGAVIAAGWFSFTAAMGAMGVAYAVPSLIWIARQTRRGLPPFSSISADLLENWRQGRWIFISGLLWAVVMYAYPWLLTWSHGVATTGAWAAAASMIAICNVPISGLQNYAGTRILRNVGEIHQLRPAVRAWACILLAISLPLVVLMSTFGGDLLAAVYGASYVGHGTVVAVLAANLLVAAVSFPISRALFSAGMARYDVYVNLVALGLLLPGMWLTDAFGITGAACALVGSNAICVLIRVITFLRVVPRANRTCDERRAQHA